MFFFFFVSSIWSRYTIEGLFIPFIHCTVKKIFNLLQFEEKLRLSRLQNFKLSFEVQLVNLELNKKILST